MISLLVPFRLGWRVGRRKALRRPVVTLEPVWPAPECEEAAAVTEALPEPAEPPARIPHCWGCGREGVSFCPDICLSPPAAAAEFNPTAYNAGVRMRAEYAATLNQPTEEAAA